MRTMMLAVVLLATACSSLPEKYVKQDRANYETLAPRIRKLMETSDHYSEDQEEDIEDRLQGWDARSAAAMEAIQDER